jgi:hypothetical protein
LHQARDAAPDTISNLAISSNSARELDATGGELRQAPESSSATSLPNDSLECGTLSRFESDGMALISPISVFTASFSELLRHSRTKPSFSQGAFYRARRPIA